MCTYLMNAVPIETCQIVQNRSVATTQQQCGHIFQSIESFFFMYTLYY